MKLAHQVIAIICLCMLTRLPQMLGPYFFLDGDECLVGIMAKHIAQAREFPLFFWGQHYGFTLVECLMIVPFYVLLGLNTLAVKLAMLTLWTVGVVFLFKTLRLINKGHALFPFLLTVVFVCLPAWAIWSMKARGGYLTAFTLSNIALYLLFEPRFNKKLITWVAIGILTGLVIQGSVFWLCGLLPILAYKAFAERRIWGVLAMATSAAILVVIFEVYKKGLPSVYTPTIVVPDKIAAWNYIKRIPDFLYASLHGNYYFQFLYHPGFSCSLLARIISGVIMALPFAGVYYLLFKRKGNMLLVCSVIFIPACFFYTLFSPEIHGRYLLPLTGFMLIPLQLLFNKTKMYKPVFITSGLLVAVGIVALFSFRNFQFLPGRKDTVLKTIDYLKTNKVSYVFCTDCMVPWQINFYSNETITARMPYMPERYAPNGEAVNNALATGKKVAVMFYEGQLDKFKVQNPVVINDFGIGLNPGKDNLLQFFYFPGMPPPPDL